MNKTPIANRIHIALFGKTNAGKSSVINALTNQNIALVSDVSGTTTDPVYKAMELLPLGPVTIIDTAGLDDFSELGQLRMNKSMEVLNKTDILLLVVDQALGMGETEEDLLKKAKAKKIPTILVYNKMDTADTKGQLTLENKYEVPVVFVSAKEKTGIKELKKELGNLNPDMEDKFKIVGDLVNPYDVVVLVTPIDKAAPKGRLILPQQQVIRDLLESDAITVVTKEFELKETLERLSVKPKLVITDSQVFLKASADTPSDVMLTSFSILFARHKGDLIDLVKGARAIDDLKDGDKVLIAEGCTHHRQSDDIGTVKIPRWIRNYTGKELTFDSCSGYSFPENIEDYALIIMCGSCMLNKREVMHRLSVADSHNVPIVNYGVAIAHVQGILRRSLEPFPLAKMILEE